MICQKRLLISKSNFTFFSKFLLWKKKQTIFVFSIGKMVVYLVCNVINFCVKYSIKKLGLD